MIDTANDQRLILGTDRVYETNNGAVGWAPISTVGSNGWTIDAPIDTLADSPAAINTIFALTAPVPATATTPAIPPTLFGTTNDGATWTQLNTPVPGGMFHYSEIIPDPANPNILFLSAADFRSATGGGLVWMSADGGKTWKDLTGTGLPDSPVNNILLDPWTKILYVGNDVGVYECNSYGNGSVTWKQFADALPNGRVVDIELSTEQIQQNARGYILAAGLHGRGVFELNTVHFNVTAPTTVTSGQPFNVSVDCARFLQSESGRLHGCFHR